jgi:hypothetical protein
MAAINGRNEVIVPALAALLDRAAAGLEIASHSFVREEVLLPSKLSTKSNLNNFEDAELWLKQYRTNNSTI